MGVEQVYYDAFIRAKEYEADESSEESVVYEKLALDDGAAARAAQAALENK